jgi:hypothetical protein
MATAIIPSQADSPPAVTLVTALADASDISDVEYRAIYDRLADGRSLRNIELALRSAVSFAWWGKYAAGERPLDRARKNELRRWAKLPELPPTVTEAVAAVAHPDAAVYRIGAEIANRIVLVGADVPAVDLRLNGAVSIAGLPSPVSIAHVTPITPPRPRRLSKSIHLSQNTFDRLNAARLASGRAWDEYLAALLETRP